MDKRNNQRGSVLLTVMLALAAVGAASFYVMNVRKNADTANVRTKYENDIKLIVNDIQAQLSNSRKCFNTLQATTQPLTIVAKINSGTPNTTKYPIQSQPGGDIGFTDSKIKIAKYKLDEAVNPKVFIIEFVNKEILKGAAGNNNLVTVRKIPMYVERSGVGGSLIKCRAITDGDMELWSRSLAQPNNIHYGTNADVRWVGIGTKENLPPPAMASALHVIKTSKNLPVVNEDFRVDGNVEADKFYYLSDKKLKTKIATIEHSTILLNSIHGVKFNWKKNKKTDYGFMAQDLQEKIPTLVPKRREHEILHVEYGKLLPVLVENLKAQQKQIQSLKARILVLKNK